MKEINQVKFLTLNELCTLFRTNKVTINRWNNPKSPQFKPHFPQPLQMNKTLRLWDKAEIEGFIAAERQIAKAKAEQAARHKAAFVQHSQDVKETLFLKQKALKEQIYVRPEKGERLAAHTLRKIQAFRLQ